MLEAEMDIYARCCRLCLSENKETLKFEDSEKGRLLRARIQAFLSIDMTAHDKISKLVCDDCTQIIENLWDFKINSQRNQSTILEWASGRTSEVSSEVKEEITEDDTPTQDDHIEVVTDNLTVKCEPIVIEDDEALINDDTEETAVTECFKCQACDVEFGNKNDCDVHEKDAHGIGTQESAAVSNVGRFPEQRISEKILFAAGLRLITKDLTHTKMENLSAIENSYINKCKAMVDMYRTLKCACHLANHPNLKGMLSHLRSVGIWFPVFTCYHCMITFTDRSSSGKHIHKCPNKNLNTLVKLSNLKKRSTLKTRIYQNYRCVKCRFIFSFHEDFCKHINEEHCDEIAPYNCPCQQTFVSLEDYKEHIYVSCMVEYYCDICNISVSTLDEFVRHSEHQHDTSEGFPLLQDDNYKKRTSNKFEPRENKQILGKRRSSTYGRALKNDQTYDESQTSPKHSKISKNIPTKCPQCDKVYSNQANMLRHFKTHQEVKQDDTEPERFDISFYRCPDCLVMYNAADWELHKQSHDKINCSECEKVFLFQSELEQHRVIHLNFKVYRDSKTHSYKTMLGPDSRLPYCDICNILCENFEDLESHKLSHEDLEEEGVPIEMPKYSCVTCNKHFLTYADYSDHNVELHTDRQTTSHTYPRQCDECEKIITSGPAFASHKAKHRRMRLSSGPDSPLERPKSRKSANQEEEVYQTCKKCFKVFSNKYNLKQHMKLHNLNLNNSGTSQSPKKFFCDRCHLTFGNRDALISHIDEEHGDMPDEFNNEPYIFTCDICVRSFSTKVSLMQHKLRQHAQDSGPSNKFVTLDDRMVQVQAHAEISVSSKTQNQRQKKNFTCEICDKSFSSQPAMYAHAGWHKRTNNEGPLTPQVKKPTTQIKSRNVEFKCNICNKELPNEVALKIHTIEKHGNVAAFLTPRCESCNQEFATQTEYENHMQLHEIVENQKKKSIYSCQFCSASFSKTETLQAHVKMSHSSTPQEYKCQYCRKSFDKQVSLTNHVKVHEKQRAVVGNPKPMFHCSICNLCFNLPKELRIHTITAHPF